MHTSVLLALILSLAGGAVAAEKCTDLRLSGGGIWVDKPFKTGCNWYGAVAQRCRWHGSHYRNEHVANEACCVCGGGKTFTSATSVPSTPSPPTDALSTHTPPTDAPSTPSPPTYVPSTPSPPTDALSTHTPPTDAPSTPSPPTSVPSTPSPPTDPSTVQEKEGK